MHTLVTGGVGFIGSHVVEELLRRGHQVTVIDDLSGGGPHYLPEGGRFHRLSVLDAPMAQLCEGIDAVVHAAAQTSVAASVNDPLGDARTNIAGTIRMACSAARSGVRRFVYLSSAAVYAPNGTPPFREEQPIAPASPYGLSKWAGEAYVRLLGSLWGFEWAVLRLANVYGPRQSTQGEAGVVARWTDAILKGKPIVIHGDGAQSRDFIFVGDVAQAVARALERPLEAGCTLNIGTGVGRPIRDLLPILESLTGRVPLVTHESARLGDIRHSALENRLAQQLLGWRPEVNLEDGLAQTIAEWKGRARGGALQ